MSEGMRRNKARGQGAHGGAQRPEPHGRPPSHLRREVTHERWSRHEDDALYESDQAVGQGEAELGVDARDAKLHQTDDKCAVDRHVGTPDLVRQPSDQGGECANCVRHHEQIQEVLKRHVVVGQHQRRERALLVVEVVEHDRGQRHDSQVAEPRNRLGVAVQLPPAQSVADPTGSWDWCLCCGHRHGPPPRSSLPTNRYPGDARSNLPPAVRSRIPTLV